MTESIMAAMEDGTEEEKQKLMDKEEIPEAKKLSKRDGTRCEVVRPRASCLRTVLATMLLL